MKYIFSLFLCLVVSHQATTNAMVQSVKNAVKSTAGTAALATVGGYIVPASVISVCDGNPSGFLSMIPSFVGAGIAYLLQQKGISAKWGCSTTGLKGNVLTLLTYFGCATIADLLANFGNKPHKSAARGAFTTLGAYAALAARDSFIK